MPRPFTLVSPFDWEKVLTEVGEATRQGILRQVWCLQRLELHQPYLAMVAPLPPYTLVVRVLWDQGWEATVLLRGEDGFHDARSFALAGRPGDAVAVLGEVERRVERLLLTGWSSLADASKAG
jgi:hypothetical protein